MVQCKWCGKKGFFITITANGLCKECNDEIVPIIIQSAEKYKAGQKKWRGFHLPSEELKIIEEISTALSTIKKYEDKGIPTITPFATELLQKNLYGNRKESLEEFIKRLKDQNDEGILDLDEKDISGIDVLLKGKFNYDESKKSYYQINNSIDQSIAKWAQYYKIEIIFPDRFETGVYREFYESGKLKREVPFILDEDSRYFLAHGLERIFYEDLEIKDKEIYTILEETNYKNGEPIGIKKRYSIDGGVMEEQDMEESHGSERKEYYPETGKLRLEEHKDWGKEYYESGQLKAEWENVNYFKVGKYTGYYESGNIEMTATYFDGVNRDGFVNKYYESGKVKELWSYNKGKRIFVKKYFENSELKTEWLYDENGNEISKKYYDKQGRLIKK